jgi:transposase
MRNIAVVTLRQLGYSGQAVAALMGLSENYVATLRNRALRQGTAGVVRQPGARRELREADWARARGWRQAGAGTPLNKAGRATRRGRRPGRSCCALADGERRCRQASA